MTELQKDYEWSKKVKERDRYRCRFGLRGCTGKATDACHIFSRRFKALRYNINNGLAGCRNCHTWTEQNTESFESLARLLVGEEIWMELTSILFKHYNIRR